MIFDIQPEGGTILPGEQQWIEVSFTPNKTDSFHQKLALRIKDNPNKKVIVLKGKMIRTKKSLCSTVRAADLLSISMVEGLLY
jgi:hypothetical protein